MPNECEIDGLNISLQITMTLHFLRFHINLQHIQLHNTKSSKML